MRNDVRTSQWAKTPKPIIFLVTVLLVLSCTTPRGVERAVYSGDFATARQMLEEIGAGEFLEPGLDPKALQARVALTRAVEEYYIPRAQRLAEDHRLESAQATVAEGLRYVPWSKHMESLTVELQSRITQVSDTESYWDDRDTSDFESPEVARLFLSDIQTLGEDFEASPILADFQHASVRALLDFWADMLAEMSVVASFARADVELARDDLALCGYPDLIDSGSVGFILDALSPNTGGGAPDIAGRVVAALDARESTTDQLRASGPTRRIVEVARSLSTNWVDSNLGLVFDVVPTYSNVSSLEHLKTRLGPVAPTDYATNLSELHIRAAQRVAGSGASAVLALLHVARARQLTPEIDSRVGQDVVETALASIATSEELSGTLTVSNLSESPDVFSQFATSMISSEILSRTRNHYRWYSSAAGAAVIRHTN